MNNAMKKILEEIEQSLDDQKTDSVYEINTELMEDFASEFFRYSKTNKRHLEKVHTGSFIDGIKIRLKIHFIKRSLRKLKKRMLVLLSNNTLDDRLRIIAKMLGKYIRLCDSLFREIILKNPFSMYVMYRSLLEIKWKLLLIAVSNTDSCNFFLDFHEYLDRKRILSEIRATTHTSRKFINIANKLNINFEKKILEKTEIKIDSNTSWIYVMSHINDFKFTNQKKEKIYLQKTINICSFLEEKGIIFNDYSKYKYLCNYTHADHESGFGYGDYRVSSDKRLVNHYLEALHDIQGIIEIFALSVFGDD